MPTKRFRRQFTSGSRPTPDPYDMYLEKEGFYRKHTARDSSSLFRVVSEQMYDTQDFHQQIRKDCVNYMIKHRDQYEYEIEENFDKYIRKMAKTETHGTLLELRAIGYLYKRNILLYQPFDLGVWLIDEQQYRNAFLRVFCTAEGHFDSIFTKSFATKAGFCQSIVYEILYKNVFKLADIEYSVEVMLHSNNDQESNIFFDGDYADQIVFEDGRTFQLDGPENTLCILNDSKLCHFHNENFESVSKELARKDQSGGRDFCKFSKSSLTDKFTSCVRQLLNHGITPFPYKVAKALDPDMYRNIEFDSWSDARKSARSKVEWKFQIGSKCLTCINEQQQLWYECYIQDINEQDQSSVVYIDGLCEKRKVPNFCLRPLKMTSYETKRCNRLPIAYGKGYDFERDEYAYSKRRHNAGSHKSLNKCLNYSEACCDSNDCCDAICKVENLKQYTDLSNFELCNPYEIVTCPIIYTPNATNMPVNPNNAVHNSTKSHKNRNSQQQSHAQTELNQQVSLQKTEDDKNAIIKNEPKSKEDHRQNVYQSRDHEGYPMNQPSNAVSNYQGVQYFYPAYEVEQGPQEFMPNQPFVTMPPYQSVSNPYYGYPAPNQMVPCNYIPVQWPAYNAPGYVPPTATQPLSYAVQHVPAMPFIRRDLFTSNGRVNFNASFSYSPSGDDLPSDMATNRFFYNFGIEYWNYLQSVYGNGQLMAMIDGDHFEQASSEVDSQHTEMTTNFQQMNFDDHITTPTPPKNGQGKTHGEYFTRRSSSVKHKRESRSNMGQNFQGTFPGPTRYSNRGKYHGNENVNRNSSYDSTPIKENAHKPNQHGHNNSTKRENYNYSNEMIFQQFGSNVPPYPFHGKESVDHHYAAPPGNAPPRTTPPGQVRSSSVPIGVSPFEPGNEGHGYQYMYQNYGQHSAVVNPNVPQMHPPMPNFWMMPPQGNQINAPPPNQSQLNTSNVSSSASNPSN